MDLHRPESGRVRGPGYPAVRKGSNNAGRQHSAYRVHHIQRLDVVKVYLQPGASLDTANAQVTAASQFILRQLPPGEQPPQIINFSASSVPILQLGISGKGLNEQQLNDYSLNFIRPQLITVPAL